MMSTSPVICASSPFSIGEHYLLPPAFLPPSKRPPNASLIPPWRPSSHPTTQEAALGSLPAPHHLQHPHHPTEKASQLDLSRNLYPKMRICCSNGVFPIIRLKGKLNLFFIRVLMSSVSQQTQMLFLLEHLKTLHNWAVSEEINLKFKFILNIAPQESLEVYQKLIHASVAGFCQ